MPFFWFFSTLMPLECFSAAYLVESTAENPSKMNSSHTSPTNWPALTDIRVQSPNYAANIRVRIETKLATIAVGNDNRSDQHNANSSNGAYQMGDSYEHLADDEITKAANGSHVGETEPDEAVGFDETDADDLWGLDVAATADSFDQRPAKVAEPIAAGADVAADSRGAAVFRCPFCDYGSRSTEKVVRHMQDSTNATIVQCAFCQQRYEDEVDLVSHARSHNPARFSECEYCLLRLADARAYEAHVSDCHQDKCRSCCVCDRVFDDWAALREHGLGHSQRLHYRCGLCDSGFHAIEELMVHWRQHIYVGRRVRGRMLECPHCSCEFRTIDRVRCHIDQHVSTRTYPCPYCEYGLRSRLWLQKHISYLHPAEWLEGLHPVGEPISTASRKRRRED